MPRTRHSCMTGGNHFNSDGGDAPLPVAHAAACLVMPRSANPSHSSPPYMPGCVPARPELTASRVMIVGADMALLRAWQALKLSRQCAVTLAPVNFTNSGGSLVHQDSSRSQSAATLDR